MTQPTFVYDLRIRSDRLSPGLLCLPFGSLLREGVPLGFSSDYPCGTLGPLMGIYAAATRRSRDGEAVGPEEKISVQAGIEAYALGAARAGGLESECGSLEAGKLADLVILDANPLGVPVEQLAGLRVLKTLVGGRQVWP